MTSRSYGQYCAVARSLDVVGDRWALLIVRDLLDGPLRYGDLLASLAPIATDMLARRLRALEEHGVLIKRALPKPAVTTVYELTDEGRALEDVVNALARWGRHLMEVRDPGDAVRLAWVVRAVRAYVRDDRSGPPLTLRLVTPEGTATVVIGPDTIESVGDEIPADVTLSAAAEVLVAAMGPGRLSDLVAAGALTITGPTRAVRRVGTLFHPAND